MTIKALFTIFFKNNTRKIRVLRVLDVYNTRQIRVFTCTCTCTSINTRTRTRYTSFARVTLYGVTIDPERLNKAKKSAVNLEIINPYTICIIKRQLANSFTRLSNLYSKYYKIKKKGLQIFLRTILT